MNQHLEHLKSFAKKLALAFLMFSLCRIAFVIFNASHFNNISFGLFFYGLRFDMVSLSYLMAPLLFFELLPFPFRTFKGYQKLLNWLFYLPLLLGVVINCIDIGYFQYTLKRTTFDFFDMVGTGDDFWKLLPNYIIDFWYAYLAFGVLAWLTVFLYKRYCKKSILFTTYNTKTYLSHSVIFIVSIVFVIIGMRGGLQYKPIDIVNAGQYAKAQNTPIVLNTPFTIFKTIFVTGIEEVNYFEEEELSNYYNPQQVIKPTASLKNKNVVILILESFSKEYIGYLNDGKGYTPFLDSLMQESYVFTNAYANGQRSIESLPGIFAGLPQLMGTPYSVSAYAGNQLDALPEILKKRGYNNSFYHGGANGTMGFNGFVGSIGVDDYYGMNEYPNKENDYDGKWGIFDEPYLQYFVEELNTKKEPFFSAVFTLSSHHPYPIPEKHKNKFPKGNLPIHETIGYTDFALKQFFNTAKNTTWFNNTIFIITADHASQSESVFYKTNLNRFAIPTFIYHPKSLLRGKNKNYFQQTDITPTVLSLLGEEQKLISFGNNAFNDDKKFVVNYISGNYQLAMDDYFLIFDGTISVGLYNTANDSLLNNNLIPADNKKDELEKIKLENKLKAIIQQYNNRIINNQLSSSKP